MLVSHGSTIHAIVDGGASLAPGESVVVRAADDASPAVLGRLEVPCGSQARQWLARLDGGPARNGAIRQPVVWPIEPWPWR